MTPERFKRDVQVWAKELGLQPKEIHIRHMKRKWASCSSRGRLTFATSLMRQHKKVRSEAIVHELLHLKYPNHGKMFKALFKAYLKK